MNTCDTCKFWNNTTHTWSANVIGVCERFVESTGGEVKDTEARLLMYHAEEAALETGSKFGCILHEPK